MSLSKESSSNPSSTRIAPSTAPLTSLPDRAESELPWLVLRTRSRQEQVVLEHLAQKRIRAYLPRRNERRLSEGRSSVVEQPLFPGYLFVRPCPDEVSMLRYVRGSCGLLCSAGRPAQLAESDLHSVRIMAASGAKIDVNEGLVPGQEVEVISGPLLHARGEYVYSDKRHRLVINARLIGRSVSVDVDARHIRPV